MTDHPSQLGGYPEFRGYRWLAGRLLAAAAYSCVCGVCFGVLSALGTLLSHASSPFTSDSALFLGVAGAYGAAVGIVSAPLMALVTTSRESRRGVVAVLVCTSAFTFICGVFFNEFDLRFSILTSLAAYACSCIAWRLWNGSGASIPRAGRCAECGYSLAGLTGDRCPECGDQLRPLEVVVGSGRAR